MSKFQGFRAIILAATLSFAVAQPGLAAAVDEAAASTEHAAPIEAAAAASRNVGFRSLMNGIDETLDGGKATARSEIAVAGLPQVDARLSLEEVSDATRVAGLPSPPHKLVSDVTLGVSSAEILLPDGPGESALPGDPVMIAQPEPVAIIDASTFESAFVVSAAVWAMSSGLELMAATAETAREAAPIVYSDAANGSSGDSGAVRIVITIVALLTQFLVFLTLRRQGAFA